MDFIFLVLLLLGFWGCSNLKDVRFSKDFVEEKQIQLMRKADVIVDGRTKVVGFCLYLNELEPSKYNDGEYFMVEIATDDEVKKEDLEFLLFDLAPLEVREIKEGQGSLIGFYKHSRWNRVYLVRFAPVWKAELPKLVLIMKFKNDVMRFDYSYQVGAF